MRNEFEKEVKRLQDEILHLKQENKHLKADKEVIEQQFIDFKIKHETIVTRLRGKIAEVALAKPLPSEGTGKIYHQPSQSPSKLIVHQKASIMAINGFHTPHHHPHPLPPPPPPAPPLPQENEGFRVPTVSELMRRSTVEHPEFKESLRRNQANAAASTMVKEQTMTNKSNKPQQGGKPGDQYQQHNHHNNTPNELMMSHQLMYDIPQPLQQQQQSHQQMKSPNFNAGIPPPPPSYSQQQSSQPAAGERGGGPPTNSSSTNVGGGTSKSLNRTLSYFDANFMKGNNVQSILDPKEATQNINNNNNAGDSSLHRAQGSMYSIANNYPAFGGGNNNNNYNNNNIDYDSSPDNTTRHNSNSNTRKMSVPMDSAYSDLAGANHLDFPVVEIDLT
jgi:hypothetical protein